MVEFERVERARIETFQALRSSLVGCPVCSSSLAFDGEWCWWCAGHRVSVGVWWMIPCAMQVRSSADANPCRNFRFFCHVLLSCNVACVTPDFHTNTRSARWPVEPGCVELMITIALLQSPAAIFSSPGCVCMYVGMCVCVSLRVLVLCLSTHTAALLFVQAILSCPRTDTTIVGRSRGRTDRDVDVPVVVAVLLHAVAVVVKYYWILGW